MDHKTLSETLADRLAIPREDVGILLDALPEVIENSVAEMDIVTIPGFGSFEPKKRDERIAVHPATGRRMLYPPKLSVAFRPSALLKKQLREENING